MFNVVISLKSRDGADLREDFDVDDFYEDCGFRIEFDDDYAEEEEDGHYTLFADNMGEEVPIRAIIDYFCPDYDIIIDWNADETPLEQIEDPEDVAELDGGRLETVFGDSCGRIRHLCNGDDPYEGEETFEIMTPDKYMDRWDYIYWDED